MRKLLCIILSCLMLTSCGNANISNNYNERLITINNELDSPVLYETLSPAIVGVSSQGTNSSNIGAGACVAKDGYIITNYHVVNNADIITLYLTDGTTINATTVYKDSVLDFAIIKSEYPLPYLSINTSDTHVGQEVIAVGTPISLMLKHTFTKGIVSATNRTIKVNSSNGEAYMHGLIQHDASLNPGNSGGPLLNAKGEVVGINTLKITSGEGIGFAIPSKSFVSILNSVINKNINFKPYLGVYGFDAEIAKFNKISKIDKGFYIEEIDTLSPAYNIIKPGDTIIAINNTPINNANDFRHELYKYRSGDSIQIEYIDIYGTSKLITLNLTKRNTTLYQNATT